MLSMIGDGRRPEGVSGRTALVGSITTLAIVLLFWPVIDPRIRSHWEVSTPGLGRFKIELWNASIHLFRNIGV